MIFVGGLLHLAVVLLPLACLGVVGKSLRDPATLVFLVGATALYAGDAMTMRRPPSVRQSRRSTQNRLATRWAAATGGLLLVLLWVSLVEHTLVGEAPPGSRLQAIGGVLLFAGVTLRALAVATLGESFRTEVEVESGSLVRNGVYRFLRHPSESGLLAATLGSVVLLQSTLGLALWCAALVPATLVRLLLEERALEAFFGSAYRRYVEQVGGLLPLPTRGR